MAVIEFFIDTIEPDEFKGSRVLELGAKYVNGSVRPLVEKLCCPKEYIGIDVQPGRFVDLVLPAERIVECFGEESFDLIVSTELLEHVNDWRIVVDNSKRVLRREGKIYVTTRSKGFHLHGYPYDFWRYELDDMRRIFSDFRILALRHDAQAPGLFLKAMKPRDWRPTQLSEIALYSMVLGRRSLGIPSITDMPLNRKLALSILRLGSRIVQLPEPLLIGLGRRMCR
jgi:SAM-dependent methyltransferase